MVFLELHINFDYSPKEKVFIYERSKKLEKQFLIETYFR